MSLGARAQSHKAKLKKETNSDTFRHIQKPGNPDFHRLMKSHSNVIKKFDQKAPTQGDVDYDKQKNSVKNPYRKK